MYNKRMYQKKDNKKVLHKVRKHWTVVSVALLGLIGMTGIAKNEVHAANTNSNGDNYSFNDQNVHGTYQNTYRLTNVQKPTTPTSVKPGLDTTSTSHQLTDLTHNILDHGVQKINGANQMPSSGEVTGGQGRVNSKAATPQVTSQQVSSAASQSSSTADLHRMVHNQLASLSTKYRLGDSRRLLGAGDPLTPNEQLDQMNAKFNYVNDFYTNTLPGYLSSMSSASNVAAAEMSRYDKVEDFNYASSAAAENDNSLLNQDINAAPFKSITADSISISLLDSKASDYVDEVRDISRLSNEVDNLYTSASNSIQVASTSVTDASNQAANIVSLFSNAASIANSYGNKADKGPLTNGSYPVVNVYDGRALYYAMANPTVHHINIMNNINMWAVNNLIPNYVYDSLRNLTVNGLRNDGTWFTEDAGHSNFNLTNGTPGHKYNVTIENLHMYGTSYWGPFSINNNNNPTYTTINKYKNITYDGSELSYDASSNTNVVFDGKIIINTGAYSPSGKNVAKTPTGYDYDSGGINAHPFDGDDDETLLNGSNHIAVPDGNAGAPGTGHGIDDSSNQEDLQVPGMNGLHNYVEFTSNCDFTGYTSNGDCIASNGNSNINLDPDSNVHLIPRGNDGETASLYASLPNAIDIYSNNGGSSNLNVENGATLLITPTDETDRYNNAGGYNDNYYPGAIHINGAGNINISPGAVVDIKYPDKAIGFDDTRSIPDNYFYNQLPGYNDGGIITITSDGKINVNGNGTLHINAGNPSNVANSNTNGNLVYIATGSGGVTADLKSAIRLMVNDHGYHKHGNDQPITLFNAPNGTKIQVNDPKEFSLVLNSNNPKSQLASNGVGVQGQHVDILDQNGNSFGQYGTVTLPGGVYDVPQEITDNLKTKIIQPILDTFKTWLSGHYGSSSASSIINNVQDGLNKIISQKENYLPFVEGHLSNATALRKYDKFVHSVDIPLIIASNVQSKVSGMSPSDMDSMLDSLGPSESGYQNDQYVSYAGTQWPVREDGFNLQHGFSFKGVPDTYIEGLSVKGQTLTGYAYPGSYIRLNTIQNHGYNNPYTVTGAFTAGPNGPSQTYDDTKSYNGEEAYDPRDTSPYHSDYIAIANETTGKWTYRLPKGVDLNSLVAVAHTQTVSPNEAARKIMDYVNGRNGVSQHDSPKEADNYDNMANNIPTEVYPDDYEDPVTGQPNLHSFDQDDTNAGHDFQAGFIKGEHDRDAVINDNSVYSKPDPFIIGYTLAHSTKFNSYNENLNVQNEINFIQAIENLVHTDYLPAIEHDQSLATNSVSAINMTISTVNSLISPAHTTDPYINLRPLSNSFVSPSAAALTSSEVINDQYNTVSQIDTQLSNMITSLNSYKNEIAKDGMRYNNEYSAANSAAKNDEPTQKEIDIFNAEFYSENANDDVNSAAADSNNANNDDTTASEDNDTASSNSNSITPHYDYVRGSASNYEANDFLSVASSYDQWGAADSAAVNDTDVRPVRRDYHRIASSLTTYQSDLAQLNSLSASFTPAKIQAMSTADQPDAEATSTAISEALGQIHNDSRSVAGHSGAAVHDLSVANKAAGDVVIQSNALSGDLITVSEAATMQSQFNAVKNFDEASMQNSIAFDNLDTPAKTSAMNDSLSADEAWSEIDGLLTQHQMRATLRGLHMMLGMFSHAPSYGPFGTVHVNFVNHGQIVGKQSLVAPFKSKVAVTVPAGRRLLNGDSQYVVTPQPKTVNLTVSDPVGQATSNSTGSASAKSSRAVPSSANKAKSSSATGGSSSAVPSASVSSNSGSNHDVNSNQSSVNNVAKRSAMNVISVMNSYDQQATGADLIAMNNLNGMGSLANSSMASEKANDLSEVQTDQRLISEENQEVNSLTGQIDLNLKGAQASSLTNQLNEQLGTASVIAEDASLIINDNINPLNQKIASAAKTTSGNRSSSSVQNSSSASSAETSVNGRKSLSSFSNDNSSINNSSMSSTFVKPTSLSQSNAPSTVYHSGGLNQSVGAKPSNSTISSNMNSQSVVTTTGSSASSTAVDDESAANTSNKQTPSLTETPENSNDADSSDPGSDVSDDSTNLGPRESVDNQGDNADDSVNDAESRDDTDSADPGEGMQLAGANASASQFDSVDRDNSQNGSNGKLPQTGELSSQQKTLFKLLLTLSFNLAALSILFDRKRRHN